MNHLQLAQELGSLQANPNAEVSIADLRRLNNALRSMAKIGLQKGGVNYPMQSIPYSSGTLPGGEFAPLVPQSIQPMLDNATFTEEHIIAWKLIAKTSATQPVHEYNIRRSHGSAALSPFVREGGVPGISESNFERNIVRMKYMATFRQVTDPAAMTGLMHPSSSAIAVASMDGMMELIQKLETFLFWADSSVNPLEFDGLHKSIREKAPSNYRDAQGATTSLDELQQIIGEMVNPPTYARPTEIWCDHRVWSNIQTQLLAKYGRMDITTSRQIDAGVTRMIVRTAYGEVPIIPIPFLAHREHPIDRPEGEGAATSLPIVTATFQAGVLGSSFLTKDLGVDRHYIIEAVGDEGVAVLPATAAVTHTAAGGASRISIADASTGTYGTASVRSYNVFEARVVTGAGAPTDPNDYWFVGRFGRNKAFSAATRFDVTYDLRPRTSPVYILTNRRDCLEWVNFLDLTRRPITVSRSATTQFMLMLFGALKVGVATKHYILGNVGYS